MKNETPEQIMKRLKDMNINKKPTMEFIKGIIYFLTLITIVVTLSIFGVWLITLLWNWLITSIFGLREITILETFGLLILIVLFRGINIKKND